MSKNTNAASLGYIVAPTSHDIKSAQLYAQNKVNKEVCESNKDNWKWVPDNITGYPCPEGLECNSGKCIFTPKGCVEAGTYNAYDCKRESLPCHIDGKDRTCDVCVFDINAWGKMRTPEIASGESYTMGCYPGDEKYPQMKFKGDTDFETFVPPRCPGLMYSNMPMPYINEDENGKPVNVQCFNDDECEGDRAPQVGGRGICITTSNFPDIVTDDEKKYPYFNMCTLAPYDPTPYIFNGEEVSCDKTSVENGNFMCQMLGAGGACISQHDFPLSKNQGKCYDNGAGGGDFGYLEWRNNVAVWEGEPTQSQCVRALPQSRKWCEMPWTRGGKEQDSPQKDLAQKMVDDHKSKLHPPFWYDQNTGKCHITRHYCEASLGEGGYDSSFGEAHEYLAGMVSRCGGSAYCGDEKVKCQVADKYDCCTTTAASFEHLVMGRTMSAYLKDTIDGKISPEEFTNTSVGLALYSLLSEDALKMNKQIVTPDFIAPNVHLYMYQWTPEAIEMYPERGLIETPRLGLMASEIENYFPEYIMRDHFNNRAFVVYDQPSLSGDITRDRMLLKIATVLASSDAYFKRPNS